ncbi:glycosyltransferase family 1 protein [Peribacillus frigoritolerans]|uniref:glycosyltransferase family 1 protein n=1 Tax=Peribacillus frigoritolerans TaxID=450367 RepID=UPI0032B4A3E3
MNKSPRRILHIFSRMDRGGAETRIMDVYRNIDRNNIQFDFLNLESGIHHYDQEIRNLGGRKFLVTHPKKGFLSHFLDMYKIFKNEGPFQAVHAHTSHHEGVVALAAKLAGVKYIICHARTTSTNNINSLPKKLAIMIGRKLIIANATKLLAISYKAGEYLFGKKSMNNGIVDVIPNAVDLAPYIDIEKIDSSSIKKELGIPNCQILIGHVGRFNKMKNHEFLLELLNHIRGKDIDARLVLVGDGELRKGIENQVIGLGLSQYVHFLGIRNDIPKLMRIFDVFVMPSKYEGLGGAAIEAQAAGTPSVLSNTLPQEVDMDLGIIQFLSLEVPKEKWGELVINQSNLIRPELKSILKAFNEKGFTIEAEIESLLKCYGMYELSVSYKSEGS